MFASEEMKNGCLGSIGGYLDQPGTQSISHYAHARGGSRRTGGFLSNESLSEEIFGELPLHSGLKTCCLPHLQRATLWPMRRVLKLLFSSWNWIGCTNMVAIIFLCLFLMSKILSFRISSFFILFSLYRYLLTWEFQIPHLTLLKPEGGAVILSWLTDVSSFDYQTQRRKRRVKTEILDNYCYSWVLSKATVEGMKIQMQKKSGKSYRELMWHFVCFLYFNKYAFADPALLLRHLFFSRSSFLKDKVVLILGKNVGTPP